MIIIWILIKICDNFLFCSGNVIHRARSLAIVRMNLIFMFAAVVASGAMVMSGKAAAERGESLQQQNLDWHKHINDTHKWSQEATMPY